jgi:hypothetical protein
LGTSASSVTVLSRSGMPGGGRVKCLPLKLKVSWPKASRMTSMASAKTSRFTASAVPSRPLSLLSTSAPRVCISRGTVPRPTPKRIRPPVRTSAMAKSSASRSGCHCGTMLNIWPNFSRRVSAAEYSPSWIWFGTTS